MFKKQLCTVIDGDKYQAIERDAADRGITIAELARRKLFDEPLPPTREEREESEDDAE